MVNKVDLLYEGKAKKVYWTSERDAVWIEFKDDATAFDGEKKAVIEGKGTLNASISGYLFQLLERQGIPTHFLETLGPRDILAKAVKIIPVEFVVRNIAAGSLAKRMGVREGLELKSPVLEFYYKSDALHDPMINEYHIEAFELADMGEIKTVKDYSMDINSILSYAFSDVGITLVDFKLEFGLDKYDQVVLADEISPDTCRLWDAESGDKMDKDRFRRDLGGMTEAYQEVWKRLQGGNH